MQVPGPGVGPTTEHMNSHLIPGDVLEDAEQNSDTTQDQITGQQRCQRPGH